jgi:hypothetical protein
MRTASRLQNGVSRLAFLGFSSVLAYAFLEEFISPFIPLIVTVLISLISGFLVRAIFVQLLNKRLFSAYRYTNTNTNKQSVHSRTNNTDTTSNEKINHERINRADPFAPPDPFSLYRNLLGLGQRFTSEELKAAYRNCAAMYHPDRYASSSRDERQNAEDLMKKVNEAYERLKPATL